MGLRRVTQLTRNFLVQGWVGLWEEAHLLPSALCGEVPISGGGNSGSSSLTLGRPPGPSRYSLTLWPLPRPHCALPGPLHSFQSILPMWPDNSPRNSCDHTASLYQDLGWPPQHRIMGNSSQADRGGKQLLDLLTG